MLTIQRGENTNVALLNGFYILFCMIGLDKSLLVILKFFKLLLAGWELLSYNVIY
jgi:hypothetical protein